MTFIIDSSDPENLVVRSDLEVPADATITDKRTVVVVDSFLDGQRQDTIKFVLDERFRDRVDPTISEFLIRGTGIVFDPSDSLERDRSNSIRLNLDGSEGNPHASLIMKHDVNREEQIGKIIDLEFRELI